MLVDTLNCPLTSTAGHEDPALFDACAMAARGALSGNTERAMRSDLAIYAAWCIERGVRALPAGATPTRAPSPTTASSTSTASTCDSAGATTPTPTSAR